MNAYLNSRSMMSWCASATLAASLLVMHPASALAKDRQVSLNWEELEKVVVGRKVSMVFPNGGSIEGKVRSVGADELIIDTKRMPGNLKCSQGSCAVPRTLVSVLRIGEVRGKWRLLGTAIGAGSGAVIGSAFYTYANNEANRDLGAQVAAGLIGGGAASGYLLGRGIDHHALIITVVK